MASDPSSPSSPISSSSPRQAVVVIHGIGEQRPMATLRSIVGALLDSKDAGTSPRFFSKPDRLSDTLELRRLAAPQSRDRHAVPFVPAPTDFYELYWAHLMEGTVWSHITAWLGTLMWRNPADARSPVRLLWLLSWGLVGLAAVVCLVRPSVSAQDLLGYGIWGVLAYAALRLAGGVGLHFVGDAARYLSPTPQNINARKNIRNAVIQLLTKLHEEEPRRYERIVVVGHSLGSVIAYDALTHLWQMRHSRIENPAPMAQPCMEAARLRGEALVPQEEGDRSPNVPLEAYRQAQRDLLAEQQRLGIDWRISDLVTLGSPLAHASFLLASNPREWDALKRERVYPTSPPQPEDPRDEDQLTRHFSYADAKRFDLEILHHAALFACTRWSNLYFPADPVGGPVGGAAAFGLGVKDIALKPRRWASRLPLAHVSYWDARETDALVALREAVDLPDAQISERRPRVSP